MVMKVSAQPEVRTIAAGEFKAKCLKLMDEVVKGNLTLIVTKRGRPVMQATAPARRAKPFVPLWGKTPNIQIHGDIMAPLYTDEELDSFGDPFLNA
jgi:antitoxin (DNA-binding transcriptional repressor) of toxin-antitoxin stability system